MSIVDNVKLSIQRPDARVGRVAPVLTATADLQFTADEVAERERYEVGVEIWAFDWDGDPFDEDRRPEPTWPSLLYFRPRPILRFTWPTWYPTNLSKREHTVITASSETVEFTAKHTVNPLQLPDPLNEDPGRTFVGYPPWVIAHEDEIYAVVNMRSARRPSAPSIPISVQTGREIT